MDESLPLPTKVLIVEDERPIRQILARIVSSAGYTPVVASDGEEGMQAALEAKPAVILTDIFMPKKTGLELCRELKSHRDTARTGIIVVTASTETPDLLKILRYGADAWVKKPFEPDHILVTLAKVREEKELFRKREVLGNWIEIELASTVKILRSMNQFMENLLCNAAMEPPAIQRLGIAINEMLQNSMEHGNRFDVMKKVRVSYVLFADRMVMKIEDEGAGFLPSSQVDPLQNPADTLRERTREGKRPGGFGIAIARQFMDELEYSDTGKVLLMTKRLSAPLS